MAPDANTLPLAPAPPQKVSYYGWVFAVDIAIGFVKNFKSGFGVLAHRIVIVSTGLAIFWYEFKTVYENWDVIVGLKNPLYLPHFFSGVTFILGFFYQLKLGNDVVSITEPKALGAAKRSHRATGKLLYLWGKFQVLGGILTGKYISGTLNIQSAGKEIGIIVLSALAIQAVFTVLGKVFAAPAKTKQV